MKYKITPKQEERLKQMALKQRDELVNALLCTVGRRPSKKHEWYCLMDIVDLLKYYDAIIDGKYYKAASMDFDTSVRESIPSYIWNIMQDIWVANSV